MNKALLLFDAQYIIKTYRKKILRRLKFKSIKKINIEPHKKHIWDDTYHVVVEYKITFLKKRGGEKTISVFCTAHSSEPKKNIYEGLKFLWRNNYCRGKLTAPLPLFYSKFFKATFYVGVKGKNLYYYIKEKDFKNINYTVKQAAGWLAKLHNISTKKARNFNKDNSRIQTVKPGMNHIFEKIKSHYPLNYDNFKKAYTAVNKKEVEFLSKNKKRWLVHGDAHPENIIKTEKGKIVFIDFSDLCLSDFARDLGSFLQQIEFKIMRRIGDKKYAAKVKKIFLDNYFKNVKIKMDDNLAARIDNYYTWAALRTAVFFFLKHNPEPERAEKLLNKVCRKLKIC